MDQQERQVLQDLQEREVHLANLVLDLQVWLVNRDQQVHQEEEGKLDLKAKVVHLDKVDN